MNRFAIWDGKVCAGYYRGEGILSDLALWVTPRIICYKIKMGVNTVTVSI